SFEGSLTRPRQKPLDRAVDVLQRERPKFLENKTKPVLHMIAHRPRNADAARRTLGLESGRHIHYVAVDIEAIWNDIADVDADAEADRLIGREVAIMGGHLLLHLHRATHCSVNALENDKQRATSGID